MIVPEKTALACVGEEASPEPDTEDIQSAYSRACWERECRVDRSTDSAVALILLALLLLLLSRHHFLP